MNMILRRTGWFQGKLSNVTSGGESYSPYLILWFSVPSAVVGGVDEITNTLVSIGSAKERTFCDVFNVDNSDQFKECIGVVVSVLVTQTGRYFNVDTILPGGGSSVQLEKQNTQYQEAIALRKAGDILLRQAKKLEIKVENLIKQATTLHSESERLQAQARTRTE